MLVWIQHPSHWNESYSDMQCAAVLLIMSLDDNIQGRFKEKITVIGNVDPSLIPDKGFAKYDSELAPITYPDIFTYFVVTTSFCTKISTVRRHAQGNSPPSANFPANTKCWSNIAPTLLKVVLTLHQHCQRCPNVGPTFGVCWVVITMVTCQCLRGWVGEC